MYLSETTDTGERVLRYESAEEIVERYCQPFPLPRTPRQSEEELRLDIKDFRRSRRRRRWRRAGILLLALLILAGLLYGAAALCFPDRVSLPWEDTKTKTCSIPAYEGERTARITMEESGGEILTAAEVYDKVSPAVVTVMAQDGGETSVGTGCILTGDGFVLTNAHVIEGCSDCLVMLYNDYCFSASLVGFAPEEDLAVLKIDGEGGEFPTLSFASSRDLAVGDTVYAIGNPLGLKLRGSFSCGIISGFDREIRVNGETLTLLQTDAAINGGNSGGPLINRYGQVIGINTAKMKSNSNIEGLNLALQSSEVLRKVNDLIEFGEVKPASRVGLTVMPLTEETKDGHGGLIVVAEPEAGSGGALAGIARGDILVSVDGVPLTRSETLLDIRDNCHAGDTLSFEVCRGGEHFTATLVLQEYIPEE